MFGYLGQIRANALIHREKKLIKMFVSWTLPQRRRSFQSWNWGSSTHRGHLEGIVGASVVNVMAEAGDEQGQGLDVRQGGELVAVLEEHIAEVGHREAVEPVVVGRVAVALPHHQHKPTGQKTTLTLSRKGYLHGV